MTRMGIGPSGRIRGAARELVQASSLEFLRTAEAIFGACRVQCNFGHCSSGTTADAGLPFRRHLPSKSRRAPRCGAFWSTEHSSGAIPIAPRAASGSAEAMFGRSVPGRSSATSVATKGAAIAKISARAFWCVDACVPIRSATHEALEAGFIRRASTWR